MKSALVVVVLLVASCEGQSGFGEVKLFHTLKQIKFKLTTSINDDKIAEELTLVERSRDDLFNEIRQLKSAFALLSDRVMNLSY